MRPSRPLVLGLASIAAAFLLAAWHASRTGDAGILRATTRTSMAGAALVLAWRLRTGPTIRPA